MYHYNWQFQCQKADFNDSGANGYSRILSTPTEITRKLSAESQVKAPVPGASRGGRPEEINKAFAGFQQYLYQQTVAA